MSDPGATPLLSGGQAPGRESVLVGPLVTWGVLIALLLLNVLVAHLPLGRFQSGANLGIAAVQVTLLGVLFMRLDRSSNLVRLAALTGVIWASFLFILSGADYLSR
ncbi:MAG: oxidase [Caulobacteraceae bacterium]|nr:oxidase [Caulobacter sp.]